jgi:hypothetical protein
VPGAAPTIATSATGQVSPVEPMARDLDA